MKDLSTKINELFEKEQWAQARKLIQEEFRESPGEHWLLDRLSVTYYEEKDYGKALVFAKKAYELAPDCPLVLWDLAGTYSALGQTQDAINTYAALIRMYPAKFRDDDCGEGAEWGSSLLLDCFFRIAVCFQKLGTDDLAKVFFEKYIQLRSVEGSPPSLYAIEDAQKRIDKIQKKSSRSPDRILHEARLATGILSGCK